MGPTPPPPLDIVTVLIAISTALFGQHVAGVVGPYAVILLGAILGAAWSASRRPPSPTRFGTFGYILMLVGWALLITVPATELLANYAKLEKRWILGPVAAVIGGIGDDWPKIFAWVWNRVRNRFERRLGGTAPSDKPAPPGGES